MTHAASAARVHRRRFYELRSGDEAFAEAWADAFEAGTDAIRDEIRRRAVEGWDEPVVSAGKVVATVRKYSDRLLELEAKRRDPQYRDRPDMAIAIAAGDAGHRPVQQGIPLGDVAQMLIEAGAFNAAQLAGLGLQRAELEAPADTAEVIAETDEPAPTKQRKTRDGASDG